MSKTRKYDGYRVRNITCAGCGKPTTSGIEGTDTDLCRICFDLAGWENAHVDGHPGDNQAACPICRSERAEESKLGDTATDYDPFNKPHDVVRALSTEEPIGDPHSQAIIAVAFERGMLFAQHHRPEATTLLHNLWRLHSPATMTALNRFNDKADDFASIIRGE